jgi:hypothetical protein
MIGAGFTEPSVSSLNLSSLKLFKRTVQANEVDVMWREEQEQRIHPGALLNDVFDEQVVACLSKRRDAAMETFKECFPHVRPSKVSSINSLARKNATGLQVINGVVPERH